MVNNTELIPNLKYLASVTLTNTTSTEDQIRQEGCHQVSRAKASLTMPMPEGNLRAIQVPKNLKTGQPSKTNTLSSFKSLLLFQAQQIPISEWEATPQAQVGLRCLVAWDPQVNIPVISSKEHSRCMGWTKIR